MPLLGNWTALRPASPCRLKSFTTFAPALLGLDEELIGSVGVNVCGIGVNAWDCRRCGAANGRFGLEISLYALAHRVVAIARNGCAIARNGCAIAHMRVASAHEGLESATYGLCASAWKRGVSAQSLCDSAWRLCVIA